MSMSILSRRRESDMADPTRRRAGRNPEKQKYGIDLILLNGSVETTALDREGIDAGTQSGCFFPCRWTALSVCLTGQIQTFRSSLRASIRFGIDTVALSMSGCRVEASPRKQLHGVVLMGFIPASEAMRVADEAAINFVSMSQIASFYLRLRKRNIALIAAGEHQMDTFVRRYIHTNLAYKFIIVPDGATAFSIESVTQKG